MPGIFRNDILFSKLFNGDDSRLPRRNVRDRAQTASQKTSFTFTFPSLTHELCDNSFRPKSASLTRYTTSPVSLLHLPLSSRPAAISTLDEGRAKCKTMASCVRQSWKPTPGVKLLLVEMMCFLISPRFYISFLFFHSHDLFRRQARGTGGSC